MSRFYVHKGVSKLLTSFLLRAYMVDYRWRYLTSMNYIDPSVKIRISHLQHKKVKDLMEIFQQLTIYFEFVFYWIGSIKTNYLPWLQCFFSCSNERFGCGLDHRTVLTKRELTRERNSCCHLLEFLHVLEVQMTQATMPEVSCVGIFRVSNSIVWGFRVRDWCWIFVK